MNVENVGTKIDVNQTVVAYWVDTRLFKQGTYRYVDPNAGSHL